MEGYEEFSGQVRAIRSCLGRRMWYGGASLRSAQWAGEHQMNFLTSSAARLLFAPDLVGTSAQIAGQLWSHAAFQQVDEVAFALPFTFDHRDYVQILTDIATKLGPALGWVPADPEGYHGRVRRMPHWPGRDHAISRELRHKIAGSRLLLPGSGSGRAGSCSGSRPWRIANRLADARLDAPIFT